MDRVWGEEYAEEYGWFAVGIRAEGEPDLSNLARIKRLGSLRHGLAELRLVDVAGRNVHHPIIALLILRARREKPAEFERAVVLRGAAYKRRAHL